MNNLIRINPRETKRLQTEFDRLFDSFFPNAETLTNPSVWTPRVDLSESEEAYFIVMDVPGLSKQDINISLHDGTLSVAGERTLERKKEGVDFVRVERKSGNFFRSFSLPKAVNKDGILAEYTEGVLTITVPKAEESKPHRIDVK
ncbi:MAG: Hsp20/alpha crystallin family protein [Bacteroidetes bacterium]|nr:Hsp20/alpha crystallin family protein [Bacteroidota bacterium]